MKPPPETYTLSNLLNKISRYCTPEQEEKVQEAYHFALEAHDKQKRKSGEPYIIHPLAVSCLLADYWQDYNVIIAALLHDVVEDTNFSIETIEQKFSPEVAKLVDGVTKISKYRGLTKEADRQLNQAESIRKMLLATTKDARVLLIKLADRLHNMYTLSYMKPEKQMRIAKETLEIFAPLAGRLGIFNIKSELEDLSFRVINTDIYNDISKQINEKKQSREEHIQRAINKLKIILKEENISAEITGRAKHFYSIYQKIKRSNKDIHDIYDLRAIRIITDKVTDCYKIFGIVHSKWTPIPGRFKDYIAVAKPNLYQSLHTTVMDEDGEPLEIQIRTWAMHRIAEEGIAAHWRYKENPKESKRINSDPRAYAEKLKWLNNIKQDTKEMPNVNDFMEHLHKDLFNQEIYVFSPKGEIFHLPKNSTVLDFAFRIHTDIGIHCYGAKIEGKMVPIRHKLQSGDQVNILTKSTVEPSATWLNIVQTHIARNKIRNVLRKKEEDIKKSFSEKEILPDEKHINVPVKVSPKRRKTHNTNEMPIIVAGMKDVLLKKAKCCNPIFGDPIVAYLTRANIVSIHHKDCKQINKKTFEKERILEASWQGFEQENEVKLEVKSKDTQGVLKKIIDNISVTYTDLSEVCAKRKDGIMTAQMTLQINHTDTLKEIMDNLNCLSYIKSVKRIY